jgi:hypothetical protein
MRMAAMSSSGRRIAFFLGVLVAFALPKRVDCGYPGNDCKRGAACGYYEVEPWGFYLIEYVAGRQIGFAYTSGDDCH